MVLEESTEGWTLQNVALDFSRRASAGDYAGYFGNAPNEALKGHLHGRKLVRCIPGRVVLKMLDSWSGKT
jgi:hypothetical protein